MANCPNCGSEHIQLKKDTNVDWGRAVAGWALLGVVGGAVGAVTGEDRNANACLNCGTSWRAADLYKTRQVIKKLTGIELDLAYEKDRNFINDFVSEITPHMNAITEAEEKIQFLIKGSKDKLEEKANVGTGLGCLVGIGVCSAIVSATAGDGALFFLLFTTFVGWYIGSLIDQRNKKTVEESIEKEIKKAKMLKLDAEKNCKRQVENFVQRHPL